MSEATPEPQEPQPQEPVTGDGERPVEVGPNGYPLNTKPADMSADHRAAFYKHQMRQAQDVNKTNTSRIKELEQKAAQWDAHDDAAKTEQQREVDRLTRELDAVRAVQDEQRRTFGAQLVATKLGAAAAAKGMTPDALNTLAGDPTRFLADGGVDGDALDAFLSALPDAAKQAVLTPGSLGGGKRTEAKPSGLAAGAALYEEIHKKKRTPAQ
jgi:hypothetical protein